MQVGYCYWVRTIARRVWVTQVLVVFVGLFTPGFGQAKRQTDTLLLNVEKDLVAQLLPFESIYELALQNSPLIRQEDATIETRETNIQTAKWAFLNRFGISTVFTRGNQSVLSNESASPFLSLSNGYRFGATASVSVGDLLNRGPHIRLAQADYRSAIAKRDYVIQGLRRDLYRLYQATLLSQRMLQLYIEGEQVALVAFQTAEINWKENRLAASEYAGASQLFTNARSRVESERVAVSTNLFDLTTLAGVPLTQLQQLAK